MPKLIAPDWRRSRYPVLPCRPVRPLPASLTIRAHPEVKGTGLAAVKAARRAAIAEWTREVAEEGNVPIWRTATEKRVKCKSDRDETGCKGKAARLADLAEIFPETGRP